MTRRWIVIAGVVVVGVIGAALLGGGRRARVQAAQTERTTEVVEGPLQIFVTGTGKVEPEAQAALSFKVAGTLGNLTVEVGQRVSAGQVLAELDPASLDPSLLAGEADLITAQQALEDLLAGPTEQQLAQAELAVATGRDGLLDAEYRWSVQQGGRRASSSTIRGAEAGLVLAEQEVDQAKGNYDQFSGLPSDDPVRALALTQLVAAEQGRDAALRNLNWLTGHPTVIQQAMLDAEVHNATANLAQAELDLADLRAGPDQQAVAVAEARVRAAQAVVDQARLVSPIDGTAMAINHRPGDSIVPGEVEIVIAGLSKLHVDTMVDELDIALLDLGQEVEITLDALPELILGGQVVGIDLVPAAGTAQYPVRVELDGSESGVRVGMTAALSILVAEREQALLVPNWALGTDPETGEVIVTVYRGEAREVRVVTLGLRNESFSEVLSGLEKGEVVGITIAEAAPSAPGGFFGPG
ncbi:MAG: efflux RND transporter periplasmic adaptor subunit [Anaerolineales bacterium]